jgi:hypothetical protein
MRIERLLLLLAMLTPNLQAQAAISLVSPSGISLSATNGSQTQLVTEPAGPVSNWVQLQSIVNGINSAYTHSVSVLPSAVVCRFYVGVANNLPAGGQVTLTPTDIDIFLQTPIANTVSVQVVGGGTSSAPSLAPTATVDINNDGIVEWASSTPSMLPPNLYTVGAQPLQVRVRLAANAVSNGSGVLMVDVIFRPLNAITTTITPSTCLTSQALTVKPSFSGNGVWVSTPFLVTVLGMQAQPQFLSVFNGLTCTLVPTPDVVLLTPLGGIELALPLALRPFTFEVQGVTFAGNNLVVSNAVTVDAL